MSKTIDERVVQLSFDNQRFEQNVGTSLSTLDKLKQALKFDGVKDSLSKVGDAANSLDFSTATNALGTVGEKFSALEVIAIGALTRIGQKAADTFTNMVKGLTLDQVTAGFDKYTSKTESVQTIMAATRETWERDAEAIGFAGTQMEYVNEQMNKLNQFTDETSYNFTDMVNNIGKFTSNGIALSDATTAMQGIATWAAVSGANTQEASRAMYNLSQAMGLGAVTLQDWKSIENANMATMEFKQMAIEVAESMGVLQKGEVTVTSFRESLKDKWFNSNVLMETLDRYGAFATALLETTEAMGSNATEFLGYLDDYADGTLNLQEVAKDLDVSADDLEAVLKELSSDEFELGRRAFEAAQQAKSFKDSINATKDAVSTGFMNIFESFFGDYEQSVQLWSRFTEELYEIFVEGLQGISKALKIWNKDGGYDAFWNAVWTLWDTVKSVSESIGEAWEKFFPSKTVDQFAQHLIEISKKFEDWANGVSKFWEKFDFSDKLKGKISADDFLEGVNIYEAMSPLQKLQTVFEGLFAAVATVKKAFEELWEAVSKVAGHIGELVAPIINDVINKIVELADKFSAFAQTNILEGDGIFGTFFSTWADKIITVIDNVWQSVDTFYNNIKNSGAIDTLVEALTKLFDILTNLAKGAWDKIPDTLQFIATNVENVWNAVSKFYNELKNNDGIQHLLSSLEQLAGVLVRLASGAWDNILKFITDLTGHAQDSPMITSLADAIGTLADFIASLIDIIIGNEGAIANFFSVFTEKAASLINLVADAVGNFMNKLFGRGDLDDPNSTVGIVTKFVNFLKGLLGQIDFNGLVDAFDKVGSAIGKFFKEFDINKAYEMFKIGAKVVFIAGAVKKVLGMFSGVEALAKIPETFNKILGGVSKAISSYANKNNAEALKDFAIALGIVAAAIFALSYIPTDKLVITAAVVSGAFGVFIGLAKWFSTDGTKTVTSIKDWKGSLMDVFKGQLPTELLDSFNGFVNGCTKAVKQFGMMMTMFGFAALAVAFGAAIWKISQAIKTIGSMPLNEAIQGAVMVGVIAGILVESMRQISKMEGDVDKAKGTLLSLSVSIDILSKAVDKLGSMDLGSLAKGVGAVGVLMLFISMFANSIDDLKSAGGIAKIGGGLIVLAAGLSALCAPIAILGNMEFMTLLQGGVAIGVLTAAVFGLGVALDKIQVNYAGIAGLGASMIVLGMGLTALCVPIFAMQMIGWEGVCAGLVAFGVAIAAVIGAGYIAQGAFAGMMSLATGMLAVGAASIVFGAGIAAIGLGVRVLFDTIVHIVESLAEIGTIISEKGEEIRTAALTTIGMLFEAVLKSLADNITSIIDGVVYFFVEIVRTVGERASDIIGAVSGAIVNIANAIADNAPEIIGSVSRIIINIANAIAENAPEIINAIVNAITAIEWALADNADPLVNAGADMLIAFMDAAEEVLPDIVERFISLVVTFVESVADGIIANMNDIETAIKKVFAAIGKVVIMAVKLIAEALLGGFPGVSAQIEKFFDDEKIDAKLEDWLQVDLTPVAEKDGESYNQGFQNKKGDLDATTKEYSDIINDNLDIEEDVTQKGERSAGGFLNSFKEKLPDVHEVGNKFGDLLSKGIDAGKNLITGSSTRLANNAKDKVEDKFKDADKLGKTLDKNVGEGIDKNKKTTDDASTRLAASALGEVNKYVNDNAETVGGNFTTGIANGIQGSTVLQGLINSASRMAKRAVDTVNNTLAIQSPSRVMYKSGEYFTEGFGNGIIDSAPYSEYAAKELASNTVDEFNYALDDFDINTLNTKLESLGDSMSDGFDMNPVITPRVDTSEMDNDISQEDAELEARQARVKELLAQTEEAAANARKRIMTAKISEMNQKALDNIRAVRDNLMANIDSSEEPLYSKAATTYEAYLEAVADNASKGMVNASEKMLSGVNDLLLKNLTGKTANDMIDIISDFEKSMDLIDDEPVIKPVLDYSDIISGANDMNGMFGEVSVGIDNFQKMEAVRNSLESNANQMRWDQLNTSMASVNESLDTIRSSFDEFTRQNTDLNVRFHEDTTRRLDMLDNVVRTYLPQLAEMDVVMNTGAMVGALAPGMNNALGQIARRELRQK